MKISALKLSNAPIPIYFYIDKNNTHGGRLPWTADNFLRHPVFVGLREDKPAHDVRLELPPR